MRLAPAFALAAACIAAACTKPDLVVVLPETGGRTGSVVVHDAAGGQAILDRPYAAAEARSSGLRQTAIEPAQVQEAFGAALAARPIPPTSFTLYFVVDSDELTAASRATFDTALAEIARRPVAEVAVTGHTDTLATTEYNDRLGLQRATTVGNMLTSRGIPASSILVAGRGERELLVPTADGVSEPRNRRVEITVR